MPLTLTLLSAAVPAERRGLALGVWGAVGGLAVALGPLVGGAIVEGINWQWIFWLNVPIGLVAHPARRLPRWPRATARRPARPARPRPRQRRPVRHRLGHRPRQRRRLDQPVVLVASSPAPLLLAASSLWELRAPHPMLPLRFFRNRAFTAANSRRC